MAISKLGKLLTSYSVRSNLNASQRAELGIVPAKPQAKIKVATPSFKGAPVTAALGKNINIKA